MEAAAIDHAMFTLSENLSFSMIALEEGTFRMGDDKGKGDYEKPAHTVKLNAFQLGQVPITQALWEAVMGKNPSRSQGTHRPVEGVTWYDSVMFCNALSRKVGLEPVYEIDKTRKDPNNMNEYDRVKWLVQANWEAKGFRLPTEAEWEYAARGGHIMQGRYEYAGSEDLDKVGWYDDNSFEQTHPVGLKAPNALGLYDMSGNVWEWCWDWFHGDYYQKCADLGVVSNPLGPDSGRYRVLRGGSWFSLASYCRVSFRYSYVPSVRSDDIGFRVARGGSHP